MYHLSISEDPVGVKWELELASFCPWKMRFKPLGIGFDFLEWGKNVKNQKWDLSTAKLDFKNKWAGKWDC